MKSRPKNTPSTIPIANSAAARGEASAASPFGKSRLPSSITVCPGRNLRVAGLGVCSVWINIKPMWSCRDPRSRAERRRAGYDPANDGECGNKAEDSDPPFRRAHWLDTGRQVGPSGDHRLGQFLVLGQAIVKYR